MGSDAVWCQGVKEHSVWCCQIQIASQDALVVSGCTRLYQDVNWILQLRQTPPRLSNSFTPAPDGTRRHQTLFALFSDLRHAQTPSEINSFTSCIRHHLRYSLISDTLRCILFYSQCIRLYQRLILLPLASDSIRYHLRYSLISDTLRCPLLYSRVSDTSQTNCFTPVRLIQAQAQNTMGIVPALIIYVNLWCNWQVNNENANPKYS